MGQKLDAKFKGDLWKAKNNQHVPDDEWIVFLAKDDAFFAVLPVYREKCKELGCDDEQMAALDKMIERVTEWRKANPDRCKKPDAAGERLLY